MKAWSKMTREERDLVFLAGAFLAEPRPINVNPRSKNDRDHAASLVERGLLSRKLTITRAGKRWLRDRKTKN